VEQSGTTYEEGTMKLKTWARRDVDIVLPLLTVRQMWLRARRWDVDEGGRFVARRTTVLIWMASGSNPDSEPSGQFSVRFHTPTDDQATIYRLEWDPDEGGTEAEVWTAMELLAGQSLR